MADVTCPACGQQNAPTQRFCGACGGSLGRTCRHCGEENPAAFQFCGSCGTALESPGATVLAEERRLLTVLFADLSGFTNFSERSDPEDVKDMVDRCMRQMGEVVERYGAAVTRVVGDELMAIFGAPVAHEDDAARAVCAGLEIQRLAAERPEEFGGLAVRVGVNTGELMFAPVGFDGSFTVMGDAVNVAARLQTAAPLGRVLVGPTTVAASVRAVVYEPQEPFTLKGKAEPVFAALAVRPASSAADDHDVDQPMVGRTNEMAVLRAAWTRVTSDRSPHLTTIVAEPGMGKTRLYREFAGEVQRAGGRVLVGRSLPYGETTGWGAFAQQVRAAAGIADADTPSDAGDKLAAAVAAVLPPDVAPSTTAHLAQIVGLTDDTAADKGALLLSARRFVTGLAERCPTALVFEDLHWADPTVFDVVESLASKTRDVPLLVLVLARPQLFDVRPGWGGGMASHTNLVLAELSSEDSRTLIGRLLPGITDALLLERLVERGGGNPLFLEELSASLEERVAETASDLPTNVRATITARIDSLPVVERQLLLDASVIGREFSIGVLAQLGTPPNDAARLLDSLHNRGFLRSEGGQDFSFKHILIREAAYATLPKAVRRERHARVARFLEDTEATPRAAVLAHHWEEAGDLDAAVRYLVSAAGTAGRAWAKGEAVALLTHALELIPLTDIARRNSVRLARAALRQEGGDHATAAAELDELMPELDGPELIQALIIRARCALTGHDVDTLVDTGQRAAALAEAAGDDQLLSPARTMLAAGHGLVGRTAEALTEAERALDEWPAGLSPSDRSYCLALAGLIAYFVGDHGKAIDYGQQGHAIAGEVHNGETLLWSGGQVGLGLTGAGRHEEALAFMRPLIAHGLDLGTNLAFTARLANIYASTLRELGASGEADGWNEQGVDLARRAGFPVVEVQTQVDLIFDALASGDVDRGVRRGPARGRRWTTSGASTGGWSPAGSRSRRADISLRQGDRDAAVADASRALTAAQRGRRLKYEVLARLVLGEALVGLGRVEEGLDEVRAAVAVAGQLGHPPTRWRAEGTASRLLHATGDDDGASAALEHARRTLEAFTADLSPDHRATLLASPVTAFAR